MAASDPHPRSDPLPPEGAQCLTAPALSERLDEEISRAERHGTQLSCLLVAIDNLDEMAREHGSELREQTLAYVAGALRRELRRFDRIGRDGRGSDHELLIVLPGADDPRGEIVARRMLDRLRTIKVEAGGARRPLRVSVGLAAWRDQSSAEELLTRTRAAAHGGDGGDGGNGGNGKEAPSVAGSPRPLVRELAESSASRAPHSAPPALGRLARS